MKKPWYKSKTIIGAAVTLIAVLSDNFGVHITGDEQTAIVEIILKFAEIIGPIICIQGRVTATGGIGKNENISKPDIDSGNAPA